MKVLEFLKDNTLILDGGMGTLLQARGLQPGELPERWNITHSEEIVNIHRAYFDAGSNIVNTNTFGANSLKFSDDELEAIIEAALRNAKVAARKSMSTKEKWVALDVGPTGKMLKPYGDLDFEDAVGIFGKVISLGEKYGADLVFIETMNDSYETKAALLAAKEHSSLPVFVSCAFGEDGKLMTGADPAAMVAMLEGMGADAIGVNCSLGPRALLGTVSEYLKYSSIPVIFKPNAGLPKIIDGKTVFDVSAEEFAKAVAEAVRLGVRAVGGCCGTTPEHIARLSSLALNIAPKKIEKKNYTVVSSYTHTVFFGNEPVLIGERINPTGKKRFKEALRENDIAYIIKEGIAEEERGVHVLDVNVGLPEIDEPKMLTNVVCELQSVCNLPLQIDTSDPVAMEAALRRYNGKAMINSVNAKPESIKSVFPLVKKYGGLVVALTLDESGIPTTAEARLDIAKRILAAAAEYGIDKKDIIFDPLALTVSADDRAGLETLRAVEMITYELGAATSLGVSNVSFGLPQRDTVNASFFTLALSKGLSAAIMNPHSDEMMKAYYAFIMLNGQDENCADFISFAGSLPELKLTSAPEKRQEKTTDVYNSALFGAIFKGIKQDSEALTREAVASQNPLDVVQNEIIPALDAVGEGFEKKQIYLPSLLMSAEAAKAAFEVVKEAMPSSDEAVKCRVVLATVKGDIHDIGKNIVRLLLENYGYAVTDLGRDVSPELVLSETVRLHAPIVGLSALMTTTVPAMEKTVKLLREHAPWCKVMVGGAVLTKEYADSIGADAYAKDAMEAVRCAEELSSEH